ncbi:zinc-ribbon domain-containing protein [Staphylococcus hominis]|uniref:zinc-ribbon domain-containing protein n=1 Tax=Staphylococcus hominis TaxID=1290 RepID=UPI0008A1A685|nr:DUF2116 family Zn-ribbon domain-containing protein [Staphylococcus hominis]MCI2925867.1 DUF2116 family Zn-ribbon domain-containing protein [Staphylococcus hominis]OFK84655.1 hypothetical protein HMPREF2799_03295 [Staphylococcus sp. HMSC057A02]
MKYCPRCGNHIHETQRFCNQCGNDLEAFEQYRNQMITNSKRKKWSFIVIVILVIAMIVVACSTYYYFFVRPVDAPKKDTPVHQVSKKDSEEGKVPNDPDKEGKETIENKKSPQINVMSDDFLENFMHKNTLNGYMGIKPGMTEKEVERIVGKSTGRIHIDGMDYESIKYGDLAVNYDPHSKEKIVTSVGIASNNISEEEFISHYNNYDKRNFRDIVYNNIKGNGYEIVVYLDGDKVGLIFAVPEY